MNIYVCIKQVPDTATKIKINSDRTWIDTNGIKWIVSPYDEFAIEEALKLKESDPSNTVTVISAGPERVKEAIRTGLAMGADKGIHIELSEMADTALTAKALAGAIKKQNDASLVLMGKEAADDGLAQVPQFVSRLLGFSCVTVALEITYAADVLTVKREVEGGTIEKIQTPLPAVIAAQKGLNEPRYASLPNIMKAKKKEIEMLTMADVGVTDSDQMVRLVGFDLPPTKQPGRKIDGDVATQVQELVKALKDEAKVV